MPSLIGHVRNVVVDDTTPEKKTVNFDLDISTRSVRSIHFKNVAWKPFGQAARFYVRQRVQVEFAFLTNNCGEGISSLRRY